MTTATPDEIREVNVRYHDAAAAHYDGKWGVGFDARTEAQVRTKLRKALGREVPRWGRVLEIGAGTGFLAVNLARMGLADEAVATDISPGMVERLEANAAACGVADRVTGVVCDAEELPFEDASFDAVVGHAVLHHVPSLDRAFGEFARVLRPGGELVFAGEPSARGDRIAAVPKRAAWRLAPAWRALMRVRPAEWLDTGGPSGDESLEPYVDVHAFTPGQLSGWARGAGLRDVRVAGEELLANWFGWANRTLESSADPSSIPWLWTQYAYRGYLALQRIDGALLEGRLPADLFYNLSIAARR